MGFITNLEIFNDHYNVFWIISPDKLLQIYDQFSHILMMTVLFHLYDSHIWIFSCLQKLSLIISLYCVNKVGLSPLHLELTTNLEVFSTLQTFNQYSILLKKCVITTFMFLTTAYRIFYVFIVFPDVFSFCEMAVIIERWLNVDNKLGRRCPSLLVNILLMV